MLRVLVYSKLHQEDIRKFCSGVFLNFVDEFLELEKFLQNEKFNLLIFDYEKKTIEKIVSLKRETPSLRFPLTLALVSKNEKADFQKVDDFLAYPFTKDEFTKRISLLEEKIDYFNYLSDLKNFSLEDAEKYLILKAVELQNGSKSKAAKILKISTRSIELKFHKWGISTKKDHKKL